MMKWRNANFESINAVYTRNESGRDNLPHVLMSEFHSVLDKLLIFKMQPVGPVFVEWYESAMQMFASKFSQISRALLFSSLSLIKSGDNLCQAGQKAH